MLSQARALMTAEGYDATTMEAVAQAADVSVGSLYNYFETKQALLLAVVGDATLAVVDAGEAVVADPPSDAREAVFALMHAFTEALMGVDRSLLRRAFGISFIEPPQDSAHLVQLDMMMVDQLRRLLEHFVAEGQVTDEVAPDEAALTLYASFAMAVMTWIAQEDGSDGWKAMLDGQLGVVFRGLQPRPRGRKRR